MSSGYKEYTFSFGDSDKGPIGFVAHVCARSLKEAVAQMMGIAGCDTTISQAPGDEGSPETNEVVICFGQEAFFTEQAVKNAIIDIDECDHHHD